MASGSGKGKRKQPSSSRVLADVLSWLGVTRSDWTPQALYMQYQGAGRDLARVVAALRPNQNAPTRTPGFLELIRSSHVVRRTAMPFDSRRRYVPDIETLGSHIAQLGELETCIMPDRGENTDSQYAVHPPGCTTWDALRSVALVYAFLALGGQQSTFRFTSRAPHNVNLGESSTWRDTMSPAMLVGLATRGRYS